MKIGYARVSTYKQLKKGDSLSSQINQLKKHGCKKIYPEQYTGVAKHRPKLDKCLKFVRKGDVLYICKLDRLGRDMSNIVDTVKALTKRGVKVITLNPLMQIDDKTTTGKMWLGMMSTFADVEHQMIIDRMNAGKAYALETKGDKAKGGRPKRLHAKPKTLRHYLSVYDSYCDYKHYKQRFPKDYAKKYGKPIYKKTAEISNCSIQTVYNIVHTLSSLTVGQLKSLKKRVGY